MNMAYEIATFRRPSMAMKESPMDHTAPPMAKVESPTSPIPPDISVDDEFNLPISLAFIILLAYLLAGAAVYSLWEVQWSFLDAFYFVFISMSTIGLGDYVPQHPMYLMSSIIYLIFGLALTSMFINVVQEKLSDSFRRASAKIGASIGLTSVEEGFMSHDFTSDYDHASIHSNRSTLKHDDSGSYIKRQCSLDSCKEESIMESGKDNKDNSKVIWEL